MLLFHSALPLCEDEIGGGRRFARGRKLFVPKKIIFHLLPKIIMTSNTCECDSCVWIRHRSPHKCNFTCWLRIPDSGFAKHAPIDVSAASATYVTVLHKFSSAGVSCDASKQRERANFSIQRRAHINWDLYSVGFFLQFSAIYPMRSWKNMARRQFCEENTFLVATIKFMWMKSMRSIIGQIYNHIAVQSNVWISNFHLRNDTDLRLNSFKPAPNFWHDPCYP